MIRSVILSRVALSREDCEVENNSYGYHTDTAGIRRAYFRSLLMQNCIGSKTLFRN